MGYLKARRDGSAQLSIIVGSSQGKKKQVAPLGSLVGRLADGNANLQVILHTNTKQAKVVEIVFCF